MNDLLDELDCEVQTEELVQLLSIDSSQQGNGTLDIHVGFDSLLNSAWTQVAARAVRTSQTDHLRVPDLVHYPTEVRANALQDLSVVDANRNGGTHFFCRAYLFPKLRAARCK